MGDLTKNLSRAEFACKCGCGFNTMDFETVEVVQKAADDLGGKVIVKSGSRCLKHNTDIGGSEKSYHMRSRAMDIVMIGVRIDRLHKYLCDKYPDRYGIGLYRTFVHIDTRSGGPVRWGSI